MEIDLYRDDGIIHVIVTGAQPRSTRSSGSRPTSAGRATTAGTGAAYADQEGGLPSDFNNNIKARSAQEAWYCSDKGLGRRRGLRRRDAPG